MKAITLLSTLLTPAAILSVPTIATFYTKPYEWQPTEQSIVFNLLIEYSASFDLRDKIEYQNNQNNPLGVEHSHWFREQFSHSHSCSGTATIPITFASSDVPFSAMEFNTPYSVSSSSPTDLSKKIIKRTTLPDDVHLSLEKSFSSSISAIITEKTTGDLTISEPTNSGSDLEWKTEYTVTQTKDSKITTSGDDIPEFEKDTYINISTKFKINDAGMCLTKKNIGSQCILELSEKSQTTTPLIKVECNCHHSKFSNSYNYGGPHFIFGGAGSVTREPTWDANLSFDSLSKSYSSNISWDNPGWTGDSHFYANEWTDEVHTDHIGPPHWTSWYRQWTTFKNISTKHNFNDIILRYNLSNPLEE